MRPASYVWHRCVMGVERSSIGLDVQRTEAEVFSFIPTGLIVRFHVLSVLPRLP